LTGGAVGPAIAGLSVGIALASAPGPVQAVLLAEAVSGGTRRGFLAQAGANLTLAVLLVCLVLGLSVAAPTGRALGALQAAGGALLLLLAIDGLRSARRAAPGGHPPGTAEAASVRPRLPPAVRGVLAVIVNPGCWLFLGAVAAPLLATAVRQGGTGGALSAGDTDRHRHRRHRRGPHRRDRGARGRPARSALGIPDTDRGAGRPGLLVPDRGDDLAPAPLSPGRPASRPFGASYPSAYREGKGCVLSLAHSTVTDLARLRG
jgi:threonine/homoserine/homoserine lactone efflux protein